MAKKSVKPGTNGVVATNRQAYHNYTIEKTFEAGLVLKGSEAKSISLNGIELRESYVRIDKKGEVYLMQSHIGKIKNNAYMTHEEFRPRKLLLHQKEIATIQKQSEIQGMTIVPTKVYKKDRHYKVEIGLAKGKNLYDKRQSLKEKDANREASVELKQRNR
jgi:SsrA-binding protein